MKSRNQTIDRYTGPSFGWQVKDNGFIFSDDIKVWQGKKTHVNKAAPDEVEDFIRESHKRRVKKSKKVFKV